MRSSHRFPSGEMHRRIFATSSPEACYRWKRQSSEAAQLATRARISTRSKFLISTIQSVIAIEYQFWGQCNFGCSTSENDIDRSARVDVETPLATFAVHGSAASSTLDQPAKDSEDMCELTLWRCPSASTDKVMRCTRANLLFTENAHTASKVAQFFQPVFAFVTTCVISVVPT